MAGKGGYRDCRACGESLLLDAFRPGRRQCKKCENKRDYQATRADPERYEKKKAQVRDYCRRNPKPYDPVKERKSTIRRKGISVDDYERMVDEQDGKCAICGSCVEVLFIDHDHECCPGERACGNCVRGLLCNRCDLALSHFGEDVSVMRRAVEYMEGAA